MKFRRFKYVLLSLMLLSFGAAIVIYPERYVQCCFRGFALWAECVLPSLFPFMILALIFIRTGIAERASLPLRRVTGAFGLPPAAAACFIMSILSGYPAGSRMLVEFYDGGALSRKDVRKLSYLCSTSGPLFIIGSVGFKMFGDKMLGWKIMLAHAFAVLAVGLILAFFSQREQPSQRLKRAPADKNLLYNTFYSAIVAVAVAGGFIAFFTVLAQFCADFDLLYPLKKLFSLFLNGQAAEALCAGLLEATTGCNALAVSGDPLAAPLAGFAITFGGVSILAQQLSYLMRAGVKPLRFAAVKAVQALLCFAILLPIT